MMSDASSESSNESDNDALDQSLNSPEASKDQDLSLDSPDALKGQLLDSPEALKDQELDESFDSPEGLTTKALDESVAESCRSLDDPEGKESPDRTTSPEGSPENPSTPGETQFQSLLTEQQQKFLEACEELFKDRYTEKDHEFMALKNGAVDTPPIICPYHAAPKRNYNRESFGNGRHSHGHHYKHRNRHHNDNRHHDRYLNHRRRPY